MHEIELKPSRRLGLLLAGMLLLTLAAISLAALPGSLQWMLGLAATVLSVRGWRRCTPITRLRIAADGRVQWRDDVAGWRDAEIRGDSFVSTALIVMRLRMADRRVLTVVLLSDSADAETLRRLRVSLRWTRRTRSDTASPGAG